MAIIEIYDDDFDGTVYGTNGSDQITVDLLDAPYDVSIFAGEGDDEIEAYIQSNQPEGVSVYVEDPLGENDINLISRASGGNVYNEVSRGSGDDGFLLSNDVPCAVTMRAINLNGSAANYIFQGQGASDVVEARVYARSDDGPVWAENHVYGGYGDDRISLRATARGAEGYALNVSYGLDGDDRISGIVRGEFEEGHSELYGGSGDDRLSVRGGDGNYLSGNQGDDVLLGSSGYDRLVGGQGDDYLRGRGGSDEFAFGAIREGERDRIADFVIGEDVIDLSGIDANAFRSGNQSFIFADADDWHGTGRVWAENVGKTTTLLHIDNGKAEFEIALLDGAGVDAGDYSGTDFWL